MYCGYVTTLTNVRKHPNADRLMLADCFGNTVCVGLDAAEGELGVYFPVDGQLSAEFAEQNNLVRKKDETGKNIGGYLDPEKRNIKALKLRGEKSDGLFMSLNCLVYTGINLDELNVGDTITTVNGHLICEKYIPHQNAPRVHGGAKAKEKMFKRNIAPLFKEHEDTEQLAYNLNAFKPGDHIEVSLKIHGTSQRTGYLPVLKGYRGRNKIEDYILKKDYNALGAYAKKLYMKALENAQPIYDWGYVTGTRRTICDNEFEGGFYGSNKFREQHARKLEGKLWKGETVYYEVAGFTDTGTPIMSSVNNSKINDKDFTKKYGKETVFSYGCEDKESHMFVYRMTMTNLDGEVVEYTPDFMRYRCAQMGVDCVPVFTNFILNEADLEMDTRTPGEIVKDVAELFYDGEDPIGKTHVREGVVVRILNRPKFAAYKHKNWYFKALEGLVKDEALAPDIEEAEEKFKGDNVND